MSTAAYTEFLARKTRRDPPTGLDDLVMPDLPAELFDFQRDIVQWALKRGRAAIFAQTGMGKSFMELAWGHAVHRATGGKGPQIDGITGASVGAGRSLTVTVDLADALFDAGYKLNVDAAAEDMQDSPRDVSVPLTTAGAGKPVAGRRYVADFSYGL